MDLSGLDLRFRIGSIPVVVLPWFWLSGLLFGSQMHGPQFVLWLLVFFVSILVHELGHALAAMAFGARASIELKGFGGETASSRPLSRWRSVAMTLAGPGAGFALGAMALGAMQALGPMLSPMAEWTLRMLVYVNFAWSVMNLLPVPPLDGGHVLLGVLGRRHERTARIIAVVAAALVVLWALSAHQTFTAILFGLFAFENVQHLRAMR